MVTFPIFVEVGDAAPLVVGGGDLALSKVRLLLKRAPVVDVAAARLAPDFGPLEDAGRIRRVPPAVGDSDLKGRPLVISVTGDDETDASVSGRARDLGVPINVPDRPALSTFSLGALVDRGTVTVAIGTDGAAPVLATRVRAEVEQSLHPRLGRLADIAREYRPRVAETFPAGATRRTFWDEVFGGEAGTAILAGDEAGGRAKIEACLAGDSTRSRREGRVILVGAGPGDPELLTLKAIRALKSADVVLHDGLMGPDVLDHARREATLISVAKTKGRHSRTQAEINALMVAYAREGKIVVRLKGGDPLLFGRGGEEIDTLRASGIGVEVIPGVTAATAAAASLQMPLTHREYAPSVMFISGHSAGDGSADFGGMDFGALARSRATLAVYMGRGTAPALARTLLEAGWATTVPAVAISRISQPRERRIATTIAGLASGVPLPLSGPTLLVIGEVASLGLAGAIERIHECAPQEERELAHA